jgi:hypothetical protein
MGHVYRTNKPFSFDQQKTSFSTDQDHSIGSFMFSMIEKGIAKFDSFGYGYGMGKDFSSINIFLPIKNT